MTKYPSLAFMLAAAYTVLCLLAVAYIVWLSIFKPGQFELAGIVILVLGLPWSLILTFAVLMLKSSSAWLLAIAYIVSCIVNGWLLYTLGTKLSSYRR